MHAVPQPFLDAPAACRSGGPLTSVGRLIRASSGRMRLGTRLRDRGEHLTGRFLLGLLLRPAGAVTELLAVDLGRAREVAGGRPGPPPAEHGGPPPAFLRERPPRT